MVLNSVRSRRVSKRPPVPRGGFRQCFPSAVSPDAATDAGEATIYKDAAAGQGKAPAQAGCWAGWLGHRGWGGGLAGWLR